MQGLYLGRRNVSLLERCLQFKGVLIEGGGDSTCIVHRILFYTVWLYPNPCGTSHVVHVHIWFVCVCFPAVEPAVTEVGPFQAEGFSIPKAVSPGKYEYIK